MKEYIPQSYMTVEVLVNVLSEFEWSVPYTLEDDLPDGIIVNFPKCRLYFMEEEVNGDIEVSLLDNEIMGIKYEYSVSIMEAILILQRQGNYESSENHEECIVFPSIKKVKQGIRNNCILLQHYLLPTIQGDFSWVPEFNRQKKNKLKSFMIINRHCLHSS